MELRSPSFFDGLEEDELAFELSRLERRRFPAGSIVIAAGDQPNEIYVTQSGHAEVSVANRVGVEHAVGRVGPGATLGEMSLFTGQPAVGTVRALADLDVLVMTDADFDRLTARYPQIYRNLGAILSERLARTNRLAVKDTHGQVGILRDAGAPPELGYALACSVAWHTQAPTLLLYLGEQLPESLAAIARQREEAERPCAAVRVVQSLDGLRSFTLGERVEELFHRYEHILVQASGRESAHLGSARVIELGAAGAPIAERATTRVQGWSSTEVPVRPDRDGAVHVPRLEPHDVEALRGGLLPASSPAGRALGWTARDFAGLKVGLALGSGSLRGYAHFGVMTALARAGLSYDYLAGTSVGGAVAGLAAYGLSPEESADVLDRCGDTLFRPTLPRKGFLSPRALRKFLQSTTHDTLIEDLPVPLALVAADIETQQEVVFRRGLLWLATLATISIPGVYPAQTIGGHLVVDGGVLNPVPTSVTAGMGADMVIAVRLSSSMPPPEAEATAAETPGEVPSALAVILRAIEIMQGRIVTDPTDATTITITPAVDDLPGAKLRNFKVGRRYIEAGEAAAEEALPRIRAALPWLRD